MLKKKIQYTNFDGEPEEKTVYFNLTKTELRDLQFGTPGGFGAHIVRAIEGNDTSRIYTEFKQIILMAYGERDGDRFVKSPEVSEAFTQTLAYDAFFNELVEEEGALMEFLKGIMPADVVAEVDFENLPQTLEELQAGQETPDA